MYRIYYFEKGISWMLDWSLLVSCIKDIVQFILDHTKLRKESCDLGEVEWGVRSVDESTLHWLAPREMDRWLIGYSVVLPIHTMDPLSLSLYLSLYLYRYP